MLVPLLRTAFLLASLVLLVALAFGTAFGPWNGPARRQAASSAAPVSAPAGEGRSGTPVREIEIGARRNGHFLVEAAVNGVDVLFLVDTGASKLTLTPRDAARVGLRPTRRDFTEAYRTANGIVRGAPVVLREVRIGQLAVEDVEATVNEGPLHVSLLGMSFLRRLDGYEVRGGRLVLRW